MEDRRGRPPVSAGMSFVLSVRGAASHNAAVHPGAASAGDQAIELASQLVALDTVTPALAPGAPGERRAVELLATRLGRRGFEIEIVGPAERPSLLATYRGR